MNKDKENLEKINKLTRIWYKIINRTKLMNKSMRKDKR